MNRLCHCIAVVASLVPTLLASSGLAEAQGVGVGVKGGYLYSSFDFDDASDVIESNNGWMAGLFFGGNRPDACRRACHRKSARARHPWCVLAVGCP